MILNDDAKGRRRSVFFFLFLFLKNADHAKRPRPEEEEEGGEDEVGDEAGVAAIEPAAE